MPPALRQDGRVTVFMPMTLVGGPTLVFPYAGLTVVTDPTFSPPGVYGGLTKTHGPAVKRWALDRIDLALISHDHHPDNLDDEGREVAHSAALALTTTAGAERDAAFTGMEPGDVVTHGDVTITAVEAQHGPATVAELTGPVIGFILRARDWPTVYFSGDNSSEKVVARIAADHPDVALAILCAGAARVATRGRSALTLDANRAARVAGNWPTARIVPVHADGWAHFSESRERTTEVLTRRLGSRAVILKPGVFTPIEVQPANASGA